MDAWTPGAEPPSSTGGDVTLVEGASFCLCTPSGDLGGVEPRGVSF